MGSAGGTRTSLCSQLAGELVLLLSPTERSSGARAALQARLAMLWSCPAGRPARAVPAAASSRLQVTTGCGQQAGEQAPCALARRPAGLQSWPVRGTSGRLV